MFGQLDISILMEPPNGIRRDGAGGSGARQEELGRGGACRHVLLQVCLGSWHCCSGKSSQTDGWDLLQSVLETHVAQGSEPSLPVSIPLVPASQIYISRNNRMGRGRSSGIAECQSHSKKGWHFSQGSSWTKKSPSNGIFRRNQ